MEDGSLSGAEPGEGVGEAEMEACRFLLGPLLCPIRSRRRDSVSTIRKGTREARLMVSTLLRIFLLHDVAAPTSYAKSL